MIDSDVSFGSRLIVSSILNFGTPGVKPYFAAITVLKDTENAAGLMVTSNCYIVPQQSSAQALATTALPGISNVAFGDQSLTAPTPAFIAMNHYLDSVNNFRNLLVMRIDNTGSTGSSSIVWATMVAGSSTIVFEQMTQPHITYRKS